jgi:cytochrome P450
MGRFVTDLRTATTIQRPRMPFRRPDVLHLSPIYAQLRSEVGPIAPVESFAGDPAWLVTGYEQARTAFTDPRFGFFVHDDPEHAPRASDSILHGRPFGDETFDLETKRVRKLLAPSFTPKRLKLLSDWIQELADDCLDELDAAHQRSRGEPVDFHEHVGWRLPVLVIGALLGVPDDMRDHVMELSDRMGNIEDEADAIAAMGELEEYMEGLVDAKRKNPGPDVISDLVKAHDADPSLFQNRSVANRAAGLVFPGHETTVARMDFGMLFLLNDPKWRDWLMADPEGRIDATVEEISRLTANHNLGMLRWAVEDFDIAGVTIRTGDLVIISEPAANRDPSVWSDPEVFDPSREQIPHLGFGIGPHVCLGQSLARAELRIVFPSVFRRFPNIRLGEDLNALTIRDDRTGGGVDRVLVDW